MTADGNGAARVAGSSAARQAERRREGDRRRLSPRTFVRSGLTPRRRSGRRAGEHHALVDWHEPHLLVLSILILLLSVTDAFLTLTLLMRGASEVNPVLDYVLNHHPALFAGVKMTLTGSGVVVLVALARTRLFRLIRVSTILHSCLVVYACLIGYEWWLFERVF